MIAAITIANASSTGTIVVCVCNVLHDCFQATTLHDCFQAITLADPLKVSPPSSIKSPSVSPSIAGHVNDAINVGNTLKSAIATIIATDIPTIIGISCITIDLV